jgi:hypothetical protein
MEVGKLLSKWWFVALLSLGIGMPSGFLVFHTAFSGIVSSYVGTSSFDLTMNIPLIISLSGYFVLFICALLTMAPRHVISDGPPGTEAFMKEGREVVVRKNSYDIRVAKYSVIRLYKTDGTFRCLPTPSGLWAIALLSLGPPFVMFAFLFLIYINDKCWRSVEDLAGEEKDHVENEKGIDELLKDSLVSAYALAREAADIRRASFHDRAFILVALSLLTWAALMVLSAPIIVDHGPPWWFYVGTAAIATGAIPGLLILRRQNKRLVAKEERWAQKLFSAMGGEGAGGSPIEVLLGACLEVPGWLSLHRKGIWTREPGKTLLSFILMVAGSNGLLQYGSIWWGFTLLSIILLALGISLFSWMAIAARTEAHDLAREWEDRMKGMGSFLGPERRG